MNNPYDPSIPFGNPLAAPGTETYPQGMVPMLQPEQPMQDLPDPSQMAQHLPGPMDLTLANKTFAPKGLTAPQGPATQAAKEAVSKRRSKLSEFGRSPYLSQALMAASKGFFDGDLGAAVQGFGQGVSAFNKAQVPEVSYGGPDDAFRLTRDPITGETKLEAVPEFQQYLQQQQNAKLAAERQKAEMALKAKQHLAPEDVMDGIGRAASVVSKYPQGDQAEAWAVARQQLIDMGIPEQNLPITWNPAYTNYGATVPQQGSMDARMRSIEIAQARAEEAARHNRVGEAQGAERISISRSKGKGGGRKATKPNGSKLPTGFILD